ncbi:EPIDERMAL PATTERNING FACTOR-like protein 5 [Prunus yedoensis var. nudiflora]|uniref:EPIDERMAL PATTERNING FACTOR-like protein 5 n=1 Tax=Prunus yedoensis var. nudiflora TaxID=2094558 RepID=A0A314ZLM4_PRUYE|nr:EPIDERMAL PATTERNING FACTOR-like protein 5 [Prunus yedoensis var. nudiflora]
MGVLRHRHRRHRHLYIRLSTLITAFTFLLFTSSAITSQTRLGGGHHSHHQQQQAEAEAERGISNWVVGIGASRDSEEPAGFIATELQIQVWKVLAL